MADVDNSSGFTAVNPSALTTPAAVIPASPHAPASIGTKRKRETAPKFYAVRIGKTPGIYHTWADCLEQVRGWPKATFKSFTSLTDAESFLKGDTLSAGSGAGAMGNGPQKWYGVQSGRVPGVYSSWPEVLAQITGWKAPKHKVFKTRIEAELYVKEGQQQQSMYTNGVPEAHDVAPAHKKVKTEGKKNGIKAEGYEHTNGDTNGEYPAGEGPLPGDAEDGFDPTITLDHATGGLRYKTADERSRIKYQAARPAPEAPVRIYTDGSSLSNGQAEAIGGVGVYFGPKDKRNISEPLTGTKQTNQRAELTAILRALEVAPKDRRVVILSDSNYAIKCANEWFVKWRENGWMNASRKPVENRDLIQKIVDILEERHAMNARRGGFDDQQDEDAFYETEDASSKRGPWEKGPAGVRFEWVKGHRADVGNNAADDLATAGAREARELVNGDIDF